MWLSLTLSSSGAFLSYVDQDPSGIGTQTVREMLLTAARLRLPEMVSHKQKKERIQALAVEFGIEHILDRRFGEAGTAVAVGLARDASRLSLSCLLSVPE